jgi:hypothetical protein
MTNKISTWAADWHGLFQGTPSTIGETVDAATDNDRAGQAVRVRHRAEDEAELRSPVRVEASADFVKQRGGVAWNDTLSVRAWFDFEKGHHLEAAEKWSLDEYNKMGIKPKTKTPRAKALQKALQHECPFRSRFLLISAAPRI